MNIFLTFLLLILCGCHSNHVSVQTQYINRAELASFYIETPDPQLDCPIFGQRLLIQWNFPKCYLNLETLTMDVTIRLGDHTEITQKIPIDKRYGYYIYKIIGEDYLKHDGIKTYKVNLLANGKIIKTWHHQLWVELITLQTPEENATCSTNLGTLNDFLGVDYWTSTYTPPTLNDVVL